jgi:hypothetical protein
MIYTITLNPALDHFLDVADLRINDANRVMSECLYAGGKGIESPAPFAIWAATAWRWGLSAVITARSWLISSRGRE